MSGWMNDHKRTAFYFVIRESDRAVYFVGRGGYIGAPGGKGERGSSRNWTSLMARNERASLHGPKARFPGLLPLGISTMSARTSIV